ncbi:hypothetical protein ACIA47_17255 [Micromonospora sp. NPDC051227]|uniref:hypothetical protein n=1 Tax=Micromonospora sp. NPDC051227 TaxID=3364285 RepID=UPI0037AF673B
MTTVTRGSRQRQTGETGGGVEHVLIGALVLIAALSMGALVYIVQLSGPDMGGIAQVAITTIGGVALAAISAIAVVLRKRPARRRS